MQLVKLYFTGISDMVAVGIGCNMKQVVRLQLRGNTDLTDACTPALAQLTNLVNLDLSSVLTTPLQLEDLGMDENSIGGEGLQAL